MTQTPPSKRFQPVQVEPGEALGEIIERLRVAEGPVVLLDVRKHDLLTKHPLLRRLLLAVAVEFGKKLQFVTPPLRPGRGSPVRTPATASSSSRRVGRPIETTRPFSSRWLRQVRAAHANSWRRRSALMLFLFAAGAGGLFAGVIFYLLPSARVSVTLSTEPFATDLTFKLDANVRDAKSDERRLPASLVRLEETMTETRPVETVVERGRHASGTVELINRTGEVQGIKAKTRLEGAAKITVRTLRDVLIPPRGRLEVPVEAVEPGARGNLDAQSLNIPALSVEARSLIQAEIVKPLTGGTDEPVHVFSEADLASARQQFENRLLELLRARIRESHQRGDRPANAQIPDIFEHQALRRLKFDEINSSVPLGSAADTVSLTAHGSAEALVVEASNVKDFLRALLATGHDSGKEVSAEIPLERAEVLEVRWESGQATLRLPVDGVRNMALNIRQLQEQLVGRTQKDSQQFLQAIPGVLEARVSLSPFWVKRVPSFVRRIYVEKSLGTRE